MRRFALVLLRFERGLIAGIAGALRGLLADVTSTTRDLVHLQPEILTDPLGGITTFTCDDYGNRTSEVLVTPSTSYRPEEVSYLLEASLLPITRDYPTGS
jgi:YD repeat-containing protein